MLIEVRPVRQLRAEPRVDLAAALGPLVETLVADDAIDLAQVRVVCEWIQYRGNFREVVEVRTVVDDSDACRLEVALDLRRALTADVGTETKASLHRSASERLLLEEWGPARESCIWRFNELYCATRAGRRLRRHHPGAPFRVPGTPRHPPCRRRWASGGQPGHQ